MPGGPPGGPGSQGLGLLSSGDSLIRKHLLYASVGASRWLRVVLRSGLRI